MAGTINFGLLNTNAPAQSATSFYEGQESSQRNALLQGQMQQMQRQNALADLAMKDDQAAREAFRTSGGDTARTIEALRQGGQYKTALELQKQQLDQEAKRATMGKDVAQTGKYTVETDAAKYKAAKERSDRAIKDVAAFNTPAEALASIQQHVQSGDIPMETARAIAQTIPQDPSQFRQWQLGQVRGLMDAKEQIRFMAPDANAQLSAETLRANTAATNARMSSEGALNRAVTTAGQGAGKPPSGYRFTSDGNMEPIPGGPADAKAAALAGNKAAGAADVDLAITTLRDAYDRLEKGGGITSTKGGILGNLSAAASASGAGQAVGKALGTQNQSARNDIAMTRPALLAALMKATGMSAKQMDSNAELKLWLATATDPTLDVESNKRALANIERKYLGASRQPAPAKTSGGVPVSDW